MKEQAEIETQADTYRNKAFSIWRAVVVLLEILAGTYTMLSFFSIVPFNVPILFSWFGVLLLANLALFYIAYNNWEKVGIRSKVSFILWSSIVLWYWVFSPVFYVISMYFTQAQLKVVSFTYFWEVPVIGGIYIVFCLLYFRPMYRYLVGEKSGIKSPQEAYDFLHQFSYKAGIALAVFVICGFIIGSFQQVYLAQLPLFGQVKLILHGIVSSFLSGLYVTLVLDKVFNAFRRRIRIENPTQTFLVGGFTQKTVIASFVVIVASIGLILIVGVKVSQDLVKNVIAYNIVSNFEDVSNYLNRNNPEIVQYSLGEKPDLKHLSKHLGSRVEAFVFGKDSLKYKFIAPETISYIGSHQEGEIEDNRVEVKVVVFRLDPNSLKKDVAVVYLSDYYSYFLSSIISVGIASILVVIFVGLIMILFTKTVTDALTRMKKAIKNGEKDVVDLKLATGDEFEEFANNLSYYANQVKDLKDGLEGKIREKTADLAEKMADLQKSNDSLENMDKAMINILEDAKELEEQLKIEKEGVEKQVEERTRSLTEAKDEVSRGWMQLQKEKARLSSSINSLSLGFIMTDTENNVIVSNPALEKILGFEASKWILSDITKGVAGKVDIVTQCEKCMKEKKIIELKDIMFGSSYLRIFIAPIATQENEVIGSVVLVEDITEAKVLERSRDEFFSIASHELRTPLTSIKGNTSMIEEYYGDKLQDKELKEMIADIHESSVRLIDIVNDFLDMSRLEQGRIEFKKEVFDVVPLVEQIVYDLAKLGKEKNIFVKFDQPSGVHPDVFADTARTKQIVYNLLGNSIKFTSNGGVTVTIDVKDKHLNVHIADTGLGIPSSSQSLLFRKFQQAENNILTRDGSKGTGLGLYISKLMAEGMEGAISLEKSVENKGSTFMFSLPLATEKDKDAQKLIKVEETDQNKAKPAISADTKTVEKPAEKEVSSETKPETKPDEIIEKDKDEVEEIKREVKLAAEIEGKPVLPNVKPEQKVEAPKTEKEEKAEGKDSEN